MQTTKSQFLYKEALQYIPGGVNSPVRAFKAVGGTPLFIKKAQGAYIFDADNNRYIDYVGSWGPMILGHAHPKVIAAVEKTLQNGLSFGAPCAQEVALAETICKIMPSIEKIRMVNSGTEAAMSALRLARAATGRHKIIKFVGCYHGHHDTLLIKAGSGALTFGTPSSPGVTPGAAQDTLLADFNDLESVKKCFAEFPNDIAAIIVEPIPANMNLVLPNLNFLKGLRTLCDDHKSLLIFDEVITGFRVALGGAQSIYNITPDLTILGKIIGGGMPVGAFGGKKALMDLMSPQGGVYQAGTLSGNPLAMTAGLTTLQLLQEKNIYQDLAQRTSRFSDKINALAKEKNIPFLVQSVCGLFGLFFTDKSLIDAFDQVMNCDQSAFNHFFHAMLAQGIYFAPSAFEAGFISLAHGDKEIDETVEKMKRFFDAIN